MISGGGIHPDPCKVALVKDWPAPKNVHELRQFIGLAQYFRKFLKGFSVQIIPLTRLLRKNAAWNFDAECCVAFEDVKQALCSAPVLVLPDPELPYEVITDACGMGVGCPLSQEGRPVAYEGRKLTDAETHYTTTEQEMLGVVYALTKWRCYLEGAKHCFTVVTDHQPNVYFSTQPKLSDRQARWYELISSFDFDRKYRPGKGNLADSISRHLSFLNVFVTRSQKTASLGDSPPDEVMADLSADDDAAGVGLEGSQQERLDGAQPSTLHATDVAGMDGSQVGNLEGAQPSVESPQEVAGMKGSQLEKLDGSQPEVHRSDATDLTPALEGGDPAADAAFQEVDCTSLVQGIQQGYKMDAYYASEAPAKAGLIFADGLWFMPRGAGPKVVAVPDTGDIRRDILHELHDSQYAGHPGMERTRQAIARLFWWPTSRPDVEAYVRGCMVCQRDKGRSGQKLGKLLPLAVPEGAWESVSLDFVGPLPETSRGHNMILTVVDRFSQMARFLPCRSDWNTEQVADLYVDRVFSMHGCPISIVSDRGPQFTSSFTTALCKLVGTKQFRSTAYHPQSNGSSERMNRVLGEMLRHFVNTRCDDWDRYLGLAESANNNAFNKSTGTTPFVICYGKHPLSPVQAALTRVCPTAADVFVGTRQDIVRLARKCLLQAQERMIAFENMGLRDEQFVVGDQVMLNTTNLNIHTMPSRKLFPKWMGPFTVTRVVN